MNKRPLGASACALAGGIVLCSCANAVDDEDAGLGLEPAGEKLSFVLPELSTFISDTIQIDQLNGGPGSDANLFAGDDPADNSASASRPIGGPGAYIDWHDLAADLANHQLMDLDGADGKDTSSFPQSNECVNSSQVLSKMDLTYVAVASNSDDIFLAVQRAGNNGDAGYYWLFTALEPDLFVGQPPCTASQSRLMYTVSGPDADGNGGDILIKGHFKPGDEPLLQVYRATRDAYVDAKAAIAYTTSLWTLDMAGVDAMAVNTTITAPGALGSAGVKNLTSTGDLDTELFAEAAVPLSVFTSGSSCGATYYGSVITRTSGSGGTSPDLKDLAGPAVFNFGALSAAAALTQRCGTQVGYGLTEATGMNGESLAEPRCHWQFDDGTESFSCSGTWNAAAGARTATVTVSDPASTCQETIESLAVDVYDDVAMTATLTGSCGGTFDYVADTTGGTGDYRYEWSFSGPGVVTADASSSSGTASVDAPGLYSAAVTVTDQRTDVAGCGGTSSGSATVYFPIDVHLELAAAPAACTDEGGMATDAVTYIARASGGDEGYSYSWSGAACAGSSCTVDPSDSLYCDSAALFVEVDDGTAACPPARSETETYGKVTTVTASDNAP